MANTLKELVRNLSIRGEKFLLRTPATQFIVGSNNRTHYLCPICRYEGPFANVYPATGVRKDAVCPKCSSYERHRLQRLVFDHLTEENNWSKKSMLHVAPETFFRSYFSLMFGHYLTTDLEEEDVDIQADLLELPFDDASFDVVYASHVLEHIEDDLKAISEIRRVLKPGGVAILPVPVVAEVTLEYPEPNPNEAGHVRAPGLDYFERYERFFSRVDLHTSDDYPSRYQVYLVEDRSSWSNDDNLTRQGMHGDRHMDIVPVCYV